MQPLPNGKLLSVSRDTENSSGLGLVVIDPRSEKLQVIDSNAQAARDLLYSGDWIAYRQNNRVYYHLDESSYYLPGYQSRKLKALRADEDSAMLVFESMADETTIICVSSSGEIKAELKIEAHILKKFSDEPIRFLAMEADNLYLLEVSKCPAPEIIGKTKLLSEIEIQYIDWIQNDTGIQIAYLNEYDGTLRIAEFSDSFEFIETRLVDGIPHETYIGMDVSFFEHKDMLGLIYMDGWKLKPKLAIRKQGLWDVMALDVNGAEGFYPVFLESTESGIRLAWHNFRTQTSPHTTFEDLAIVQIQIRD